jgi:hypothetical protein
MSERSATYDPRGHIDLRVQDPAALAEIELYAELMIVAAASRGPLTVAEIDDVLGVGDAAMGGADTAP